MKLIVGLGNPDKKYDKTRHNIGHRIITALESKNLTNIKLGINSGFMNESGFSVQKLIHFYKLQPQDFYLVHDDLDIPVGEWRLQFDRGPAGHHGVESVIQHLGTQAFNRVRVGIGKPTNGIPIENYVLQSFTPEEEMIIKETIDKIVAALGS